MSITCSDFSIYLCQTLHDNGHDAYVVGGFVRDSLLKRPVGDIDITTSATPDVVESLFAHTIPTGKLFGTITVMSDSKKESIEVTTFRTESGYSNSRHPDKVNFEGSLMDDLSRRDFTINAMAYNPLTNELVDVFHGQDDLKRKCIRTVGTASQRFMEDSLRLFRACRFSAQLGFKLEVQTKNALVSLGRSIPFPSMERIHTELDKVIYSSYPAYGLYELSESQLLTRLGIRCDEFRFDELSTMDNEVRWAYLFSGSIYVEQLMHVLRFSNSEIKHVSALIESGLDIKKARFSVKDLALSGSDIQELGYSGVQIGEIQRRLKLEVLDNELENSVEALRLFIKDEYSL